MNAKSFHHSLTTGNSPVTHCPHYHVHTFWREGNKIPKCIMSGCCLGHFIMRFWLNCMNKIRKFDSILDKKDRYIISDQIIVTFFGVEFYCKSPYVACQV